MKVEKESLVQRAILRAERLADLYVRTEGVDPDEEKIALFLSKQEGNLSTNFYVKKVLNYVKAQRSLFPWAIKKIEDAINTPKYGCLMYYPEINLEKWKDKLLSLIPQEDCILSETNAPEYELDPHITLLHGFIDEELDYKDLVQTVNDYFENNTIQINLDSISVFENERQDVVKISIIDPIDSLKNLNQILRDKFDYVSEFEIYIPHMTLAYVKSGTGAKYDGMFVQDEQWGIIDENKGKLIYSDANRNNNIVRDSVDNLLTKAHGVKVLKTVYVKGTDKRKAYMTTRLVTVDPSITYETLKEIHANVGDNENSIRNQQVQQIEMIRKDGKIVSQYAVETGYPSKQDHATAFKDPSTLKASDFFQYLMSDISSSAKRIQSEKELISVINIHLQSWSNKRLSVKDLSTRQLQTLKDKWQENTNSGRGEIADFKPTQKQGIDGISHGLSQEKIDSLRTQLAQKTQEDLFEISSNFLNYTLITRELAREQLTLRERLSKGFESEDLLEKGGKGAMVGETRMFGGREYVKTPTGWKFHGKGKGVKAQEHVKGAKAHNEEQEKVNSKKEEEESKPKKTLEEYAKQAGEKKLREVIAEGSDPEVRAAAHKELDRREKEEHVQKEEEKKPSKIESKVASIFTEQTISPNKVFKNKTTQGVINDLTSLFKKAFVVAQQHNIPLDKRKELWNEKSHLSEGRQVKTETIHAENIIPTQSYLNKEDVLKYIKDRTRESKGGSDMPLGVRVPKTNKIVLFDGHHRVASDILSGKTEIQIKTIGCFGLFKSLQDSK